MLMVVGLGDIKVFSNLCDPCAGWEGADPRQSMRQHSHEWPKGLSGRHSACLSRWAYAAGTPQRSGPDGSNSARDTARHTRRPRPHSFRHRPSPRVILPRPGSLSSAGPLPGALSPPRRPHCTLYRGSALPPPSPRRAFPAGLPDPGDYFFPPPSRNAHGAGGGGGAGAVAVGTAAMAAAALRLR